MQESEESRKFRQAIVDRQINGRRAREDKPNIKNFSVFGNNMMMPPSPLAILSILPLMKLNRKRNK